MCSALQVFDPVSASDTGEYTCQAQNGYGSPVRSDPLRMEAGERGCGRVSSDGVGSAWPCSVVLSFPKQALTCPTSRCLAAELNVGGIVAAVLVTLILLGVLIFGIWFAYSRGYFDSKYLPAKALLPTVAAPGAHAALCHADLMLPSLLFQE